MSIPTTPPDAPVLAADIGGSKTRLALWASGAEIGDAEPLRQATVRTAEFASAEALLASFVDSRPISSAAIAVAGAVTEGVARGSNLPWHVDAAEIAAALCCAISVINDLEATALSLLGARPSSVNLQRGQRDPRGVIGIVAPGTGIGEAGLVRCGGSFMALRSEGGHADFAPNGELQRELLAYLASRYGHVSLERACSGVAIPTIYRFLSERAANHGSTPTSFSETTALEIAEATDPTPTIATAAMEGTCDRCVEAMNLFVSILGAAAGNLALRLVATGGVYLAGGIPPRILPLLLQSVFLEAFNGKGRFEFLARTIPVDVLMNPDAALHGAARIALTQSP